MKRSFIPAWWWAFVLLVILCACQTDDDDDDGTSDDDTLDDDDDDDDTGDDDSPEPLYAAAGHVVLTPTAANHPEQIYLGGVFPSRLGTGVHDDLLGSALALQQGETTIVVVSLDFLAFTRTRIREIQERLAAHGLEKENILIASTHTHEAPDTLGVFGPNVLTSGVSPTYIAFVQDAVVNLALEVVGRLEPVSMIAGKALIDDPLSNEPTLAADLRYPHLSVDHLAYARFDSAAGQTVATLVNWHTHPEVMIESTLVSADFPQWLRQRVEEKLGGACVYVSGALGGLITPTGVDVPARDENGDPLSGPGGEPLYYREGTWDKARSLGFVLADYALADMTARQPVDEPRLRAVVREMLLPVTNPIMLLAFYSGLLEFDRADVVTDQPELCGFFGCTSERIAVVEIGPVGITTSPGETFPETYLGREESTVDFEAPWGPFTFPAMDGILAHLDAEVPMHMAECGNEVGYLIPRSDFHPRRHPDYYEEDLYFGKDTETIYRAAMIDLLDSLR